MIFISPPQTAEDRTLVVEMACDYTDEQLHLTGRLPAASLLTADTLTLIIRKDGHGTSRPVGALSMATRPDTGDGGPYSDIHAVYLQPRWRGRGFAAAVIAEFCIAAPYTPFLRGPMPPVLGQIARALGIRHADINDVCTLGMVTSAFLNTVGCVHTPDPCRNCIHSSLRVHFTQACDAMAKQLDEGKTTA